jgi:ribosome biogenesis protein Nip4
VGKPEGKIPLERPRRRWEDGIKMDLRETGWGLVEWIHLAQVRDRWRTVVNAVIKLLVLVPRVSYFLKKLIAIIKANHKI